MRTRYACKITLTARERSALRRWVDGPCKTVRGDNSLVEGVMRRVLDEAKKEAHGKGTIRGP